MILWVLITYVLLHWGWKSFSWVLKRGLIISLSIIFKIFKFFLVLLFCRVTLSWYHLWSLYISKAKVSKLNSLWQNFSLSSLSLSYCVILIWYNLCGLSKAISCLAILLVSLVSLFGFLFRRRQFRLNCKKKHYFENCLENCLIFYRNSSFNARTCFTWDTT